MRRAVAALPLAGSAAAARSQQQPRHRDDEFRVLVVGAGLGGCVCASELRKRFEDGGPTLRLSVWERATYCAGRFGARAVHGGRAVDLGSQVLSVVDPSDARAAPGHGVSAEASIAAFAEASRLARAGLLVPADDGALAGTEERLNWPGLWRHYRAATTLSDVLEDVLARARPADVRFGRRVDAVAVSDRGIVVSATQRPAGERVAETFDAVVVAVAAPDALAIGGAAGGLPAGAVVAGVAYDARTAAAFFFDDAGGAATAALDAIFRGRAELDAFDAPGLELVARARGAAAVVAHGPAARGAAPPVDAAAVLAALGDDERLRVVYTKTVPWDVAQVARPAEALAPESPVSASSPCVPHGTANLVLCGDYCTTSSFLGTFASARAAAIVVRDRARPK